MKKWIAISGLIILASCGSRSTVPPPVETLVINSKPIEKPAPNIPEADQIATIKIKWINITPDTVEEEFAKLAKKGIPLVFHGLTSDDYNNWTRNNQLILESILQNKIEAQGYKDYYLGADGAVSEQNNQQ